VRAASTLKEATPKRCGPRLPAIATATAATPTTTAATATVVAATTTIVATSAATVVTAAATTAVTTATATAATAAETTTTATATTARLTLLGFIHAQRPTVEGLAVHALDRLRGFFSGSHRDECEAARAACFAIGHEVNVADRAELLERSANTIGGRVKGKVSNVQTSVHRLLELALE
jgi:hypothetical protein